MTRVRPGLHAAREDQRQLLLGRLGAEGLLPRVLLRELDVRAAVDALPVALTVDRLVLPPADLEPIANDALDDARFRAGAVVSHDPTVLLVEPVRVRGVFG